MLTRIQALNYRSLRYVDQDLTRFQVLVGANASGKSTFLNVVSFLSDLVSHRDGLEAAVRAQADDVRDLTWMRQGKWFELAVETGLPDSVKAKFAHEKPAGLRYEVRIGLLKDGAMGVLRENLWLLPQTRPRVPGSVQRTLFPTAPESPASLVLSEKTGKGYRKIVRLNVEKGNVYFGYERKSDGGRSAAGITLKISPRKSSLASLPDDAERFPAAIWFRDFLLEGVQKLVLNSEQLRNPAAPGAPRRFRPDGSNMPHVVEELRTKHRPRFDEWLEHVRTALPDLKDIQTVERPEDRKRYLVLEYASGLVAPSWLVSDGTLRLLALTILPFLLDIEGAFLIEEPENGIHPRAVETVFQALSGAYRSQVFLATHSPVVLSGAKAEQVLCFARTPEGMTDIVRGDRHPRLTAWKGQTDLGTLFAGGVLG